MLICYAYGANPDSVISSDLSLATEYSILWLPLLMLLITAATKNSRQTSYPTWYFATWLTYTRWLSLINASTDSLLTSFFYDLVQGVQGYQLITSDNHTPVPTRFSEMGVTSYYFINNTEKFLIIFFGSLVLCIGMSFIGLCNQEVKNLQEKTWGNLLIRALLVCIFDFLLFGMLQIDNLSLATNYGILSSLIAVVVLVPSIVAAIYVPIYVNVQAKQCEDEVHHSTLLQELSYKQPYHGHYYSIFLVKRLITAIALVFLQSYPLGQVAIIGATQAFEIGYLVKFSPFTDISTYYTISAEICQMLIVACVAVYISNPDTSTELFMRWLCYFAFWAGAFICIARFLATLLKKRVDRIPERSGSVVPVLENIQDFAEWEKMDRIEKTDKAYKTQVENLKELPMEFVKAKTINDVVRTRKETMEIRERPDSFDGEGPTKDIIPSVDIQDRREGREQKPPPKAVEEDNANNHPGIPYYSKLAAKYTRGFTKHFS